MSCSALLMKQRQNVQDVQGGDRRRSAYGHTYIYIAAACQGAKQEHEKQEVYTLGLNKLFRYFHRNKTRARTAPVMHGCLNYFFKMYLYHKRVRYHRHCQSILYQQLQATLLPHKRHLSHQWYKSTKHGSCIGEGRSRRSCFFLFCVCVFFGGVSNGQLHKAYCTAVLFQTSHL